MLPLWPLSLTNSPAKLIQEPVYEAIQTPKGPGNTADVSENGALRNSKTVVRAFISVPIKIAIFGIPSGKLTELWNINYKWPFSIAM